MKKYGISDNFIVMDDDCFIGKPLKKKDFFYIVNGKVTPLIISNLFLEIDNNLRLNTPNTQENIRKK